MRGAIPESRGVRGAGNAPAFVLLLALALVFFAPVLFQGETFFAFDTLLQHLPWSSEHPGFRAQNPFITDPVNGRVYPVMHALKSGTGAEIPLWNPAILGGLVLPPPSNPLVLAAYLALPIPTAHDLLLLLYFLAAAWFTFLFLRELGLDRSSSLAGSLAWTLNGYVMVWLEYEWSLLLAATLPAMLFYVERWLRTRRRGALLGLVVAASFALCSDTPEILVYEWLLAGAWIACRGFATRDPSQPLLRGLRGALLPVLLGFALAIPISANVFSRGLAQLQEGHRQPIPFAELHERTGALPIAYLRTLLFPDFYGSPTLELDFTPRPGEGHPYNNYVELCIYAGIVPLFLAMFSLAQLRRLPVAFFACVALGTLWLAAGSRAYRPIATLFPGLDLTTPTRILFLFGFAVAVLAALGLQRLREGRGPRWPGIGLCSLLAAAALGIAYQVQSPAGIVEVTRSSFAAADLRALYPALRAHFAPTSRVLLEPLVLVLLALALVIALARWRSQHGRTLLSGLLLAALAWDLGSFATRFNTTSPRELAFPETDGLRLLRSDPSLFRVMGIGNFLHGGLVAFGLQDVGGYSSFLPRRYAELLLRAGLSGLVSSASEWGLDLAPPGGVRRQESRVELASPLVDLLDVKYVLAAPRARLEAPGFERIYEGEIAIFRNHEAFPRAFFVPAYELAADRAAAYRALGEWRSEDFRARVLLESPPPPGFASLERASPVHPAPEVRVVAHAPDRVELELETPAPGFVVLVDGYHPDWRARVNGRETPVLLADYAFRAVAVGPGAARVVFEFRPVALRSGFLVTLAGWTVLGGACLAQALRAMRPRIQT